MSVLGLQENIFSTYAMSPFLVVCSIAGLYIFYRWIYWNMRGIPTLSVKFPFLSPLYQVDGLRVITMSDMVEYYREMKEKGYKFAGVLSSLRSVLIVKDLELIKDVLLRTNHFHDRGFHYSDMYGPPYETVVALDGSKWKKMRDILFPSVLDYKLKLLPESILDISEYLLEAIEDCALEKRDIDVKELLACFTTDVITYHSFKRNCYSYRQSRSQFCKCRRDRLSSLGVRSFHARLSRKVYHSVRNDMKFREAGDYKKFSDLFSLQFTQDCAKNEGSPASYEIFVRLFLFLHLSFDICSTTLHFALYELCRNPNIQKKVRDDINNVLLKHNGEITWKNLSHMKYLDQVICETLRLYTPVPNMIKRCEKGGYKLMDTDISISSITDILVPLFSLHRDAGYFADPEKFHPSRFDGSKDVKDLPFFMPYGEGPREWTSIQACMMQTKIGLVQMLRKFRLSISPKTSLPLRLKPQAFLKSQDILYINAEKI